MTHYTSCGACALGLDTLQEHGGGFVVPALLAGEFCLGGDELATEGLGQDSLGEFVGALRGCSDALFDPAAGGSGTAILRR